MKIQHKDDKEFLKHDFTASWTNDISYGEWCNFLNHHFNDESRKSIYDYLNNYLIGKEKLSFCEIGFGQAFDFEHCFKKLHDENKIVYNGFEITQQFVDYAKQKYPSYHTCFDIGSFDMLGQIQYDIIYTRHVLEHQHPNNCYKYFENILKSTKDIAIISWFKNPSEEENFTWNNRDGKGKGAYVNTYDEEKLFKIELKLDFFLSIISTVSRGIRSDTYIYQKML